MKNGMEGSGGDEDRDGCNGSDGWDGRELRDGSTNGLDGRDGSGGQHCYLDMVKASRRLRTIVPVISLLSFHLISYKHILTFAKGSLFCKFSPTAVISSRRHHGSEPITVQMGVDWCLKYFMTNGNTGGRN